MRLSPAQIAAAIAKLECRLKELEEFDLVNLSEEKCTEKIRDLRRRAEEALTEIFGYDTADFHAHDGAFPLRERLPNIKSKESRLASTFDSLESAILILKGHLQGSTDAVATGAIRTGLELPPEIARTINVPNHYEGIIQLLRKTKRRADVQSALWRRIGTDVAMLASAIRWFSVDKLLHKNKRSADTRSEPWHEIGIDIGRILRGTFHWSTVDTLPHTIKRSADTWSGQAHRVGTKIGGMLNNAVRWFTVDTLLYKNKRNANAQSEQAHRVGSDIGNMFNGVVLRSTIEVMKPLHETQRRARAESEPPRRTATNTGRLLKRAPDPSRSKSSNSRTKPREPLTRDLNYCPRSIANVDDTLKHAVRWSAVEMVLASVAAVGFGITAIIVLCALIVR